MIFKSFFLIFLVCFLNFVTTKATLSDPKQNQPEHARVESNSNPHVTRSIESWCKELDKELLSVQHRSCVDQPWQLETYATSGKPIPYMFWGNPEGKRILVIGAMHGDEISAISLVFRWIDFLKQTKKDSFLRDRYYLLVPLLNPDGFFANPRTRTNLAGVDLNRNFQTSDWSKEAQMYWKRRAGQDPRRFPGHIAGSELETKLIQKWIEDFKPLLIISTHAPYGLVDHDGPIEFPKNSLNPLPLKVLGSFPGSLGRYAGVERKIPVVTVELGAAKKIPPIKTLEDLFVFIMKAKF